jgi:diacylglycerol O-acyltransferase
MTLRRLSGLDAALLVAETPSNHMHMMAIMILDPSTMIGGYSFEGLRDIMVSKLELIVPLRRRLIEVPMASRDPTGSRFP